MKKALITGITGQDGAYLAQFLLKKDYKVFGLIRRVASRDMSNLEYLDVADKISFIDGDLTDEASLISAVKRIYPDEIYNLAAQSFVGISWDQPLTTFDINATGTLRILNAVKTFCPTAKFYQASTSEMFGNSNDKGVQSEATYFHPRSPYAIAKLAGYWLAVNYRESYNMFCANGILFNHESPIRGKEFVTRKITDGVAKIKFGLAEDIKLGNLDSFRDWGFAGDYVEAMWLMLQQNNPDDFIISTGENHSIKDLLNTAFNRVGIKDWSRYVKLDPQYKRPSELFTLKGQNGKAKEKLGWKPKVGFEQLINMMVDVDLERIKLVAKKLKNKE